MGWGETEKAERWVERLEMWLGSYAKLALKKKHSVNVVQ